MRKEILNLGIILMGILLLISMGSLTFLFTNGTNDLFGIGLIVILLLVVVTFIVYLLLDLRHLTQEEQYYKY